MKASKIELKVAGKVFEWWKSATVKRALNCFASSFDLTISGIKSADIQLNSPCQILIGGTPVITGYIDNINPSYDSGSHSLKVSGRSKTADLVDCSAILPTGQIMDSDMKTIVTKLIEPFGIKLVFNVSGAYPVANFILQQGETVASAIEKLCKINSLIFYDDANGNLVIAKFAMGVTTGKLVHKTLDGRSNNILSGTASYSSRERFGKYVVKSQITGSDETGGEDLSTQTVAEDKEVKRYRPLVIVAESSATESGTQSRATLEKALRIGKSFSVDYIVQEWHTSTGAIWMPNTCVIVDDDFIKVSDKLMISETSFTMAENGKTTALHLCPPETFVANAPKVQTEWFSDGVQISTSPASSMKNFREFDK